MGFEIVAPGQFNNADALAEGQCSISKSGKLAAHASSFELAGIGAYAIVMADRSNLRLALRKVRDGEQPQSVAVSVVHGGKDKHDTGRRSMNLMRGIKALGLTTEAVAGRYELLTHGGDAKHCDLLIIALGGESFKTGTARGSAKK